MKFFVQKNRGFSLVEIIIYIGIASLMFGAITSFIFLLVESRNRNIAINEVEQQGSYITKTIAQTIRNANSINIPIKGADGKMLSLSTSSGTVNFLFSGDSVYIKRGTSPYTLINNSKVNITNTSFENLSRTTDEGVVSIEFTVEYDNPSQKDELNYSKIFYASASIR